MPDVPRSSFLDTPSSDSFLSFSSAQSSSPIRSTASSSSNSTESSENHDLRFADPASLLDFLTRHWREHFVTEDISTRDVLEPFLKRPFVLLVSVDAPSLVRYRRHARCNLLTLTIGTAADDFKANTCLLHLSNSSKMMTKSSLEPTRIVSRRRTSSRMTIYVTSISSTRSRQFRNCIHTWISGIY